MLITQDAKMKKIWHKYIKIYNKVNNETIREDKDLERKRTKKKKLIKKEKQEKIIPDDLLHFQTPIDDFWKVKKVVNQYRHGNNR